MRQLLTESLLLAVIGGVAGVVLAWWSLDALVANIPMSLPSDVPAAINGRVLAFAVSLACVTGLLFGLAPALTLSRVDLSTTLARASRRVGASLSRRSGQALVAIETALAVVLLMGAGLMLRSFTRILDVDLGFRPGSMLTLESAPVALDAVTYADYYAELVRRARTLPGVAAAGAVDDLPLGHTFSFYQISTATKTSSEISAAVRTIVPGYFEALNLRPLAGRLPTDADLAAGRHVIVLNKSGAEDIFGTTQPIGQAITVDDELAEVIGVVPDVRFNGPADPIGIGPQAGLPVEVFRLSGARPNDRVKALILVVRPTGSQADLGTRLRQMAQQIGPKVVVERVRTGEEWLDADIITPRRRTVLLTLLGALGLVLTLVGIFGMTAYAVARRTQEIGVRMAFGARPGDVVRTMLGDATLPVGVGLVIGLAGAALATRLIESFLFQTTPTDAGTFAMVAATLAVTAVVAAWIPARRAARVDPVQALRAE
jgi:predicted permease